VTEDGEPVAVRPITESDVACVQQALPRLPTTHEVRLALQEDDRDTYLIAWLGDQPVGHLLIRWDGPTEEGLAATFSDCAHLEDVRVHTDYQSRGIGAQLMRAAENQARQRGYNRAGFAVGLENIRARTFYQRLGYQDAGIAAFLISWEYLDKCGRRQREGEMCTYFVKEIDEGTPSDGRP
jgi:GNAT superfamily N-acetyltransferase